jgi:hypothetical protein
MTESERTILGLQLYMCSSEPVIKWLEEEGCTTMDEALDKLQPIGGDVMQMWATSIGRNETGACLSGTVACMKLIEKHYESKNNEKTKSR